VGRFAVVAVRGGAASREVEASPKARAKANCQRANE
jgi:hypothetical protein